MVAKLLALLVKVLPGLAKWAAASRAHLSEALQVLGVAAVVAGVAVLWGLGITLLVGGVLAVGLGVLFEKETG
jgi:uncharacterized protein YjeT (DUF2065 family)